VARELRIQHLILRLDGRVFEAFATNSTYSIRWHVETVQFESAPPDKHGEIKVRIAHTTGAERLGLKMSEAEYLHFVAFVDAVKAAQAAGLETG
jgi:hypothetical protein